MEPLGSLVHIKRVKTSSRYSPNTMMTTMSYNAALVMMEVHRQQVPHGELSPNLVKTIADQISVALTSEEVVYISDHA